MTVNSLALPICSLSIFDSLNVLLNKDVLTSVPTATEAFAARYWLTMVFKKPTIPIINMIIPPVTASLTLEELLLIKRIKKAKEEEMGFGISSGP